MGYRCVTQVDIRNIAQSAPRELVISGDFFQLPPVPDQYEGASVPSTFCFDALSWRRCIKYQVRLTTVFRQKDPGSSLFCFWFKIVLMVTKYSLNSWTKWDLDKSIKTWSIRCGSWKGMSRRMEYIRWKCKWEFIHWSYCLSLPSWSYPRKIQVLNANTRKLDALSGKIFSYQARDCGRKLGDEEKDVHDIRISNLLDTYSIAPRSVILKVFSLYT